MRFDTVLGLGALAGFSIFIGLPVAKSRILSRRVQGFLNATATGILFFLLWDVLDKAVGVVEGTTALARIRGWEPAAVLAALLVAGMGAGLMTLIYVSSALQRRGGMDNVLRGPGAVPRRRVSPAADSHWIAMAIAVGLGLHNLSEGLAIGQSANLGEMSFTVVLVVGFALHNVTEGFGIAAPMAGDERPPSWRFLGLAGLVGGGPTLVGTMVGYVFTSVYLSVLFLSLASGALIYVINEMASVGRRLNTPRAQGWGILVGFTLALVTDLIMTTGSL